MLKRVFITCTALACLAAFFSGAAGATDLLDSDCVKCHPGPPAEIRASGGAHTDVTCSGCHEGHPPKVMDNIPACADCHNGDRHYDKPSCSRCHATPHSPLQVVLPSDNIDVCRECHAKAVALIAQGGSLHSEMVCDDCHAAHRHAPACLGCHEPHSSSSLVTKCQGCHDPHLPRPVIYKFNVADGDCGACHASQFATLHASTTKHSQRSCVSCHQKRHGNLINCSDCHGLPHRLAGEATFADCEKCHGSAHNPDPYGGTGTVGKDPDVPKSLEKYLQLGKEDRFLRDLP
jgi:predicted CXXCH cytochrome family protein